jgi:uncharacterized lipoprotein YddW (UPF0748 family)
VRGLLNPFIAIRSIQLCVAATAFVLTSCTSVGPINPSQTMNCSNETSTDACPPPAPREFRAAWVATVANIDWPSKSGLTSAEQQAEIIAIVNRAAELNLNALLLQVRTSADALYPSTLEPWSEFLTGEQGRAPSPAYDPLKFWIDEAHKRGIELHAWFNPYRARHDKAKSPNARNHIAVTQPNIVKSYGGYLWLDPGESSAADHTLNVIMDVVKRYDVDGVHIDDYFYPYPVVATPELRQSGVNGRATTNGMPNAQTPATVVAVPEREVEFPDEPSWQRYVTSGGKLSRADWRRQNVNQLVEKIYTAIKREKPWVRFGVSPFGLGRPGKRPPGISGFSQYDKLYADVELWLQRGWLDYLAPQLYWPIDQTAQAFPVLLEYWHRENTKKRHVFAGLYTSRIDDSLRSWMPSEIINQIALTRRRAEPLGHVHFSVAALMQNRRGVADELKKMYAEQTLIPQAPTRPTGIDSDAPLVRIAIDVADVAANGRRQLSFQWSTALQTTQPIQQIALWLRYGREWQFTVMPASSARSDVSEKAIEMTVGDAAPSGTLNAVVASPVDRYGREGARELRLVSSQ